MPAWLLPALFTAGSVIANKRADSQRQDARNDALRAQRTRDESLERQQEAATNRAANRYEDPAAEQENVRQDLSEMFTKPVRQAADVKLAQVPTSDNVVISDRAEKSQNEANQDVDERGAAMANFRSFGDLFGSIGRDVGRDAREVTQLSGFRRGGQSVLPIELEAAAQKGQGAQLMADLFGMGAQITGGRALSGGAGGAAPPPPAGVNRSRILPMVY